MSKKRKDKPMSAVAVDYPPAGDDPLSCYPHGPTTTFGDDLFDACTVPAGGSLEVVTQPAHGTVAFTGHSWQFTMTDEPTVNTEDSFTYRVADGQGGFSEPATVRLNMAVEV